MSNKKYNNKGQMRIVWGIGAAVLILAGVIVFAINMVQQPHLEEENPDVLKSLENVQNKELLPDGTTIFTFDSPNPARPNLIISIEAEDKILFERSVISQEGTPVTLSQYLQDYGQADRVVEGSDFYGTQTQLYIYPNIGVAFVADPETDRVLELHTFTAMSSDDYLQSFAPYAQ